MSKEIPLQKAMFTDELVDARSNHQKRQDSQREKPRQSAMFSAQETVQMGVNPRPWLKHLPAPTLALEIQDVRTDKWAIGPMPGAGVSRFAGEAQAVPVNQPRHHEQRTRPPPIPAYP